MSYPRGTIVLVSFPFSDLSQQKARPALVVSSSLSNPRSSDVILVAISSQVPSTPNETELTIRSSTPGFAITGLRVSSVIKTLKIVTLDTSLIYTRLGRLPDTLLSSLDECLKKSLSLM